MREFNFFGQRGKKMIIIGEKINGTRTRVAKAISERDAGIIKELATRQVEAGANYLDVNAGTHPEKEPEDMVWLVNTVQSVVDVPLCLDSANPPALEAGLEAANKTPMLNSLSGEKKRIDSVLPLAAKHNTELIVLALDDAGIPESQEKRMEIVRHLVGLTRKAGLPEKNLYIDPLVTAVATNTESGNLAFSVMRQIKEEFPEIHLTAGLSNISFGLPLRSTINQAFMCLAMAAGLDSAIINPEDINLRTMSYTTEMLLGMDKYCLNFSRSYREGKIGTII